MQRLESLFHSDVSKAHVSEKRPTISDIAALAGVSVTTVDRVMSDRAKVSHRTTIKVLGAMRALGLAGKLPPGARGSLRFEVVLTLEDETFFQRYRDAFLQYGALHGIQVNLSRVTDPDQQMSQFLAAMQERGGRCHGLIVVGRNSLPMQSHIVKLARAGTPTILLVSPMESTRDAGAEYIGIDNYAAGRTAGYLLGAFLGGKGRALLITNALGFQAHTERVRGFMEVCAQRYPGIAIIGPVECRDLPGACAEAVAQCLALEGDIDGVYNTGAGNAGIAEALAGRTPAAWIAHELTPVNAGLLMDGAISTILDQDVKLQVEACIQELLHRHGILDQTASLTVPFHLVTPENLGAARGHSL